MLLSLLFESIIDCEEKEEGELSKDGENVSGKVLERRVWSSDIAVTVQRFASVLDGAMRTHSFRDIGDSGSPGGRFITDYFNALLSLCDDLIFARLYAISIHVQREWPLGHLCVQSFVFQVRVRFLTFRQLHPFVKVCDYRCQERGRYYTLSGKFS